MMAVAYRTASVCIPPSFVRQACDYLNGKAAVCTVVGFPNGYTTTAAKEFVRRKDAIKNGASEIDMVINIGWPQRRKYDLIENEIRYLKEACGEEHPQSYY